MQVKAGQDLAFEASLSWLRGKNVDISSEAAEIKVTFWMHVQLNQRYSLNKFPFLLTEADSHLIWQDYTIYIEQVTQKRCLDMFQWKYAHCLIVRDLIFSDCSKLGIQLQLW